MYRWLAELGRPKVSGSDEGMNGAQDNSEQERLVRLAALGVPMMASPRVSEPSIIEQAAARMGMTPSGFMSFFSGRAELPEDCARHIVYGRRKKPPVFIDRSYIERMERGYRFRY